MSVILACRLVQLERQYNTAQDFANAAGVSRGTLHALKTGLSNVTVETIERLSVSLKMPVCELFGVPVATMERCLQDVGIDPDCVEAFLRDTNRERRADIRLSEHFPALFEAQSAN